MNILQQCQVFWHSITSVFSHFLIGKNRAQHLFAALAIGFLLLPSFQIATLLPAQAQESQPAPTAPDKSQGIVLIGDSLSHQANAWKKLQAGFADDGWDNVVLNAQGCRGTGSPNACSAPQIKSVLDIIELAKTDSYPNDSVVAVGDLNAGLKNAGTIVLAVGVNDKPHDTNLMESKIRAAVSGIRSLNADAQIYWTRVCTLQFAFGAGSTMNAALDRVADELGINLIDWAGNCRAEYITDGIHYNENGSQAYADTIVSAVSNAPTVVVSPQPDPQEPTEGIPAIPQDQESDIIITARGNQGDENIELQINGDTAAKFDAIGTSKKQFAHSMNVPITIESIRVAFTNDNEVEGELDRYVEVDQISINGTVYQTEASTTRSLGVWPASGNGDCGEGYKQSERIVCEGWVEYEAAEGIDIGTEQSSPDSVGDIENCSTTEPLQLNVDAPAAGEYNVWVRAQKTSNAPASIYAELYSQCIEFGDIDRGDDTAWVWTRSDNKMQIEKGDQTLNVHIPDGSLNLDKVLFIEDSSCTPTGEGDNCIVPPLVAPLVGIESEQTIDGYVTVFTKVENAADPSVEFFIDGQLASSNETLLDGQTFCLIKSNDNQCGKLDHTSLSEGEHTILLRVSDGDRAYSLTRSFTVVYEQTAPTTDPDPTPDPSPSPDPSPTPEPEPTTPFPSPDPTPPLIDVVVPDLNPDVDQTLVLPVAANEVTDISGLILVTIDPDAIEASGITRGTVIFRIDDQDTAYFSSIDSPRVRINTVPLKNGEAVITATLEAQDGQTEVLRAAVNIVNSEESESPQPVLVVDPEEPTPPLQGEVTVTVPEEVSEDGSGTVTYTVDGEVQTTENTNQPEITVDTTRLEDGPHEFGAVVQNSDGTEERSSVVANVSNGQDSRQAAVDDARSNGAPTIVVGSGGENSNVEGEIIVTIPENVSNTGEGTVIYDINGEIVGSAPMQSPEITINTEDLADGENTIGAEVLGSAERSQATITTSNGTWRKIQIALSSRIARIAATAVVVSFIVGLYLLVRRATRKKEDPAVVGFNAKNQLVEYKNGIGKVLASGSYGGALTLLFVIVGGSALAVPDVEVFEGSNSFIVEAEDNQLNNTFERGTNGQVNYVILGQAAEESDDNHPHDNQQPPDEGPTTIGFEAESFTNYNETTPGNQGDGACRTDAPDVDLKASGSGCTVGWVDGGEWLEWEIDVPAAGLYTLSGRYANGHGTPTGARFSANGGSTQISILSIPATADWSTQGSVDYGTLTLNAGTNTIRFDQAGFIDLDTFSLTGPLENVPEPEPTPEPETPSSPPPNTNSDYNSNLSRIRGVSYRNRNTDNSPFRTTPSADLPIDQLLGPRSEYLGKAGGNIEPAFPVPNGGQNRTACEFSHFAYDDPLVYPGQPGKAHLHMFFGNTDVNAYSTYDTLINSGGGTCNGGELNRTGYWAPAMFDGNGNIRVPERAVVYYKGEGLARGNSEVYPEGAAVIANDNISASIGDASYHCSTNYSGETYQEVQAKIPACDGSLFVNTYGVTDPYVVLEMVIKFPQCWNGKDPSNWRDNWRQPVYNWYGSNCTGEYNRTFPNLEYFVNYRVDPGENTRDWYLSSDINPNNFTLDKTGGSSLHADWWGGWNKEVNQTWINNCVNFTSYPTPSGCGFGYLSNGGPNNQAPYDGPALKYREQYEGPYKIPAQQVFNDLCTTSRTYNGPRSAAYCNP